MTTRHTMAWLAAAAFGMATLHGASAAELRGPGLGTCYADGKAGCRPLRAASRVRVTYGPSIPMYPESERVFVVNQGPNPANFGGPEVEIGVPAYGYGYGLGGYAPFYYGGGRYEHRFRPGGHYQGYRAHGGMHARGVGRAPAAMAPRMVPRVANAGRPAMAARPMRAGGGRPR